MCKKAIALALSILLSTLACSVQAADAWFNEQAEAGLFTDDSLWNLGSTYPGSDDMAGINGGVCIIDSTMDISVKGIRGPGWTGHSGLFPELNITGGRLEVAGDLSYGMYGGSGTINITSETGIPEIHVGKMMHVGGPNGGSTGILNIYDGSLKIGNTAGVDSGILYVPWSANEGNSGIVNLYGGTITAYGDNQWNTALQINGDGYVNLAGGRLVLHGDFRFFADPGWYVDTGAIRAYEGRGRVEVSYDPDAVTTSFVGIHPLEPDPAHMSTVLAGPYVMNWVLPDPNLPGGIVSCDVYLSTDPNITTDEKIVDNEVTESVEETFAAGTKYFWRIDIYDTTVDSNEPDASPVFIFDTGNIAPNVNAGSNVYTWLTGGFVNVDLDGTVTDDDRPGPYTVLWTVDSEPATGPAAFTPASADQEDLTVTLTAVGDYVLRLTADDGELTDWDTVTVFVREDACQAAKAVPGFELIQGDFDEDCDVDLADLAVFAANWLLTNSL